MLVVLICLVVDLSLGAYALEIRDPILWPFASDSIWNMPIGSNASYVPANIDAAERGTVADVEPIFMNSRAPLRNLYLNAHWSANRCVEITFWEKVPIEDSVVIGDAGLHHTPNGCGAFLLADNRTVLQANPVSRCTAGGNVTAAYRAPYNDLYTDGRAGSRGATALSALGGSIRLGEMIGKIPIRHVLKISLWAAKYCNYTSENQGFRWPAYRADSYAAERYEGKNPIFLMGALFAIRPSVVLANLKLQTKPGVLLFHALQDYGAYLVGDAALDAHQISIQIGGAEEFESFYGFAFQDKNVSQPWVTDVSKLFQSLYIVNNNDENNVGGGGKPRQPLAPPLIVPTKIKNN